MTWLAQMYVTLMPGLIASVLNMVWCSTRLAPSLNHPLDHNKTWKSKRIFGDNKTWKGVVGMVGLGMLACLGWGALCASFPSLGQFNLFYTRHANTVGFNLVVGALIGLAYALFELPNSFAKRRLDVTPGQPARPPWNLVFIIVDQIDSIIGMVILVSFFAPLTLIFALVYIIAGGLTHVVFNLLLYGVGLRKNPL
ncbi:MAG: CDP-archaeol synthase [Propionibacteriaceae bacterium]|jgi:hypothetical protein|nr:CDP-archaeol synthase [Propionibacteriaceae bacterium]